MRIVPIAAAPVAQLDPDIVWSGMAGDLALTALNDPVNPGGLLAVAPLQTAVITALMTDCRADPTELRDGDINRGWPGDAFDREDGEAVLGSKLWLLRREALRPGIETRAEDFAREALQPLIDQGAFVRFDVVVAADRARNRLDLDVTGYGRDGAMMVQDRFALLWEGL